MFSNEASQDEVVHQPCGHPNHASEPGYWDDTTGIDATHTMRGATVYYLDGIVVGRNAYMLANAYRRIGYQRGKVLDDMRRGIRPLAAAQETEVSS